MGIRNYTNTGQTSTLSSAIGATDTTFTLVNYVGDPPPPFTAAIARGTATEEVVLVTGVSGSTVTVTRGYDGTAAQAQGAGSTFQEVVAAQDFREANTHVNATSGAHGVTGGLVGTTDVQTLTNKTLTSPTLTGATLTGTSSATTLNVTTLTVSGVATLASLNVTGTLGVTGALTASGGVIVPTGKVVTITDAPANSTDAVNKDYADTKASIAGDLGGTPAVPTVTSGAHHTHTSVQVSDATSAATASRVIRRDSAGRAQVVDPSASADIATKNYVDSKPVVRARRFTSPQTIPTNGFTTLVFDTVDIDTTGTSYATTGLTIHQDGIYRISAGMSLGVAGSNSGRRAVQVLKNGVAANVGRLSAAGGAAEAGVEATGTVALVAGDVLTVQLYQDSGISMLTNSTGYGSCFLEAEWLRP